MEMHGGASRITVLGNADNTIKSIKLDDLSIPMTEVIDATCFRNSSRQSLYHYVPTEGIAIMLIILFGISTSSRLNPKAYTIFFLTFDVVSLVVQGVGGGLVAVASGLGKDPTKVNRVVGQNSIPIV
ncbi:hypothetical protein BYT27DRAFT_7296010 [Phlegmacium glaucopus]|nr:hypothetical protein BYT27DRAFT_7296010 [Phlegmacium glaucopus]